MRNEEERERVSLRSKRGYFSLYKCTGPKRVHWAATGTSAGTARCTATTAVCAVEVVVVVVTLTIPRYPEVRFPFPARKGTGGRVPGKENSTCTRRLEVRVYVQRDMYRTIDPASAPQFLADSKKEHEDRPASSSTKQPSCNAKVQNLRPSRTT